MIRLALAAGVAAALLPVAAAAQPYYDPPSNYPDEQTSRSAGDYSRDSADRDYDRDRGDNVRDNGARGDEDRYGGDHFTGRVGSAWRDADGRRCRWREVSREDTDGYQSYKWVTVCR